MEKSRKVQELHKPVLLEEVLELLQVKKLALSKKALPATLERSSGGQGKFIDATLGLGGHSIEMIKLGAQVLGIDADSESIEIAEKRIRLTCPTPEEFQGLFRSAQGNFKDIDKIASSYGFQSVDGILYDLGLSSYQFEADMRGFSFNRKEEPLDMRIDRKKQNVKASDLLNVLSESQLVQLFSDVLDKFLSRVIAKKIVSARRVKKIVSVGDFLNVIGSESGTKKRVHPATLPFLALRIAVNSELMSLSETLPKAFELLRSGGRLAIISFHSGEDRIVKNYFTEKVASHKAKLITKNPVVPTDEEIYKNVRSRSAKLRVLEKI